MASEIPSSLKWVGAAVLLLLGIWGLSALTGSQVEAGDVGVVSTWGAIDAKSAPRQPGFNLVVPFVNHITAVSTQVQAHQFSEVDAATSDQQELRLWGVVNYHIDSQHAAQVTIEGGPDAVIAKVFDPVFQSSIKSIVPKFDAQTVLLHRPDMEDQTLSAFKTVAGQYGIVVERVVIRDSQFSPDYNKAIEAKAVAQQKLAQAQIEAQTKVAQANGDKQAEIVQAEGHAQANQLLGQNLTPQVIQWMIANKWDGHLPQAEGGTPIISLGPSAKP
jgi:regulator of protease activity HflC (stomatin/prohibitin superfamily)